MPILYSGRLKVFVKDCMPCLGLGYYGEDAGDACETCQGSGEIELDGTRLDYQGCWLCCGTGYGGISVRSACRTCMGTGLCTVPPAQTDVFGWIARGKLKVRIGHEYPLAEAAQAHRDLEARKTTGKVLLVV